MSQLNSVVRKQSVFNRFILLLILSLLLVSAAAQYAAAAPTVITTSPQSAATAVPATASVTATFSEPMDAATITPENFTLSQRVGVKAIAPGQQFMLALRNDGTVVAWGRNTYGQTTVPVGLGGVTAIAAGSLHALALKNDGTVVAWGNNTYGQAAVPVGLGGVTAIAAGSGHSVALTGGGVITWGKYRNVPAGITNIIAIAATETTTVALKSDGSLLQWSDGPATTLADAGSGITAIAGGYNHVIALRNDGTVVAWENADAYGAATVPAGLTGVVAIAAGVNYSALLKNDGTIVYLGSYYGATTTPSGLSDVKSIAAGYDTTVAMKNDGSAISWGGPNDSGHSIIPVEMTGITAIDAGGYYSLAVTKGTVTSWGRNYSEERSIPAGLNGVTAVAGGGGNVLALKGDGTVVSWGQYSTSYPIPGTVNSTGASAIAVGTNHYLALLKNGSVAAWGANETGQINVPTSTRRATIAVSAGYQHSVALLNNRTVVVWGYNGYGQASVPTGLSGVIAIAAGSDHTLAVKSDGTVVAWGYNDSGQSTVPSGLTNVVKVAGGNGHSLALKSDGTVVAWGSNTYGETNVPPGLKDVVAIAAGPGHSLALKSNGTVVGWGDDTNGQSTTPASPYSSAVTGSVSYDLGSNQATFVPAMPLRPLTPVTATMNTGVRSQTGVRQTANYSWNFTTANATFRVTPDPVDAGSVAVGGSTLPIEMTLFNNGTTETVVSAVTISGPDALMFSVSPGTCGPLPAKIPAGSGCTLSVIFTPASDGSKTANLRIDSNDILSPSVDIPLYGTGSSLTNALTLIFSGNGSGTVTFSTGGNCSGNCSQSFAGDTSVSLTPSPAAGSTFVNWSGCDAVSGTQCFMVMTMPKTTTATFTDTVAPTVSATPPGGGYVVPINVTLTANEPATIYYTSNGANPTTGSPVYSTPIPISASCTLKYFGLDPVGNASAVKIETYTFPDTAPPTVSATPPGGGYVVPVSVVLTANEPATIYYTSNGATPTTASPVYLTPIPFSINGTLKYFGVDTAGNTSSVKTETYTFGSDTTPPATTASPAGGTYSAAIQVTLSANEPATIYYTTNGTDPTTSSTVYSGAIPLSVQTTLKYFARDGGGNMEAVKSATYYFNSDTTPPVIYAFPGGGVFASPVSVTLSANEPATIYYTTNGTTPSTASPVYSAPFNILSTATLKYFGRDTAGNSSAVGSQLYTIDTIPPITTPSPVGGTFANPVSVTLAANEPATIYYTTNGTTPTTASPVYSGPVSILSTAMLKFFAKDTTGNMEAVKTQSYVIKLNQTIDFPEPPIKTFGDPQFTISATAGSNLPVTFASSNPTVATVSGNTVTILTAGTTFITATQAGNEIYNPALAVQQTLTVEKATATITFGALTFIYDGSPKPVIVTSTPAGLAVSVTYDSSATPPTNAGSYTVIATVNDLNWQGTATVTEEIARRSQAITFDPLPAKTFGDPDFELTATVTSNQALYYSSSNTAVATLVSKGNKTSVQIIGAGTAIITAYQDGNNNYSPAIPVPQTLTVAKLPQIITFTMVTSKTVGDPAFSLSATVSSGLLVSYTSSNTSVATVSGNSVTIVGPGTTIITALQPGDNNYNVAVPVSYTLTVSGQSGTNYVSCILGGTTNYYDTISQSFAAMTNGWTGTMKLQNRTYVENVNLNVTGASITLTGGYDGSFGSMSGYSTIQGSLTVTGGVLIVDRLVIM